jgi:antitoxin component of RelBE/YafQ-DinJ toxin-antitoxin module
MVNAKVDSHTKQLGDEVLRRNNKTNSGAVQELWEHLAKTGDLPDFMRERTDQEQLQKKRQKIDSLRQARFRSGLPREQLDRDAKDLLGDVLVERYGS